MDALSNMRMEFNRYLLDAIGGQILDTSVFSWDAGFTAWLLGICLTIAFFQSILRNGSDMLVEWTKIVVYAWFAMAILGGVNYKNVPALSRLDNVPPEYKVKVTRTRPTLERAVFNWLSYKFDTLGKAIVQSKDGKDSSLADEVTQLTTLQGRLADAVVDCQMHDQGCLTNKLNGKETEEQIEKDEMPSGLSAIPWAIGKVGAFMLKISNPAYVVFPILTFILEMVRGFVNMFVLVAFGITAAMGLFFLKILSVLMVIPSYRDRVLGMWKTVMSASLYGFAMNLVIWISVIITKALNEATVNIVIKSLTSAAAGGSAVSAGAQIYTMMIANFLTAFVILAMQVVALAKVPKLCEQLMNLSLNEIVNLGENLIQAGMGVAKMAAGFAMGAGGLALGGAAAMAAKGLTGSSIGELGQKSGDFFKNMVGAGTSADRQLASSPAKSGGGSDSSGDGGAGGSTFGSGPSRSSGSLESSALGGANMQATLKGNKSLLKKKEDQEGADFKTSENGEENAIPSRPQTVLDKKIAKSDKIDNAWNKVSSIAGSAPSVLMDLAFDGLNGGFGSGDPMSTLKGGISSATKGFDNNKEDYRQQAIASGESLGGRARTSLLGTKDNNSQRAMNAELIRSEAIVAGKKDMSEVDNAEFDSKMSAVMDGTAKQDDMIALMQMKNRMNLSDEQNSKIQEAKTKSADFNSFSKQEEAESQRVLEALKNNASDKNLQMLAERTSAGLMDFNDLKPLGNQMRDISKQGIEKTISPLAEKVKRGEQLNRQELNVSKNLFDNQQTNLVGDTKNLENFKTVLGSSANTRKLEISREDSVESLSEIMNNIEDSVKKGELDSSITNDFGLSLGSKTTESGDIKSTSKMDGLYIAGQAITSKDDYYKLDEKNKRLVDDLFNMVDLATDDKETNDMMKEKMSQLKLKSENLKNLKNLSTRIRGK